MRHLKWLAPVIAALLLLSGCGGGNEPTEMEYGEIEDEAVPAAAFPAEDGGPGTYEAPPLLDSAFHEDKAEGKNGVQIDMSAVSDGYVGVSAVSDSRLKFQVMKEDSTYTYDLSPEGTPSIIPLQSGDGSYRFRVMENVGESKYVEKYAASCTVALTDEYQPYLRPNDYVRFSVDSECVRAAAELAKGARSALDVVSSVFDYVCGTVSYDREKAAAVKSMYLPDPDETLRLGSGICFDYASLVAAMLRSQGIPAKVIFGYVSPNGLYHAWNMFYTEQTGWVTVSYEVKEDS